MTAAGDRMISASRQIAAEPGAIWAVLTDTSRHPEIDGSGTVRGALRGGTILQGVGDHFSMSMRIKAPYLIRNTVMEFEPERRIAWRHVMRHRWRYELEPNDDGTLVTETFDYSPALVPHIYGLTGVLKQHARSIPKTLERFAQIVE